MPPSSGSSGAASAALGELSTATQEAALLINQATQRLNVGATESVADLLASATLLVGANKTQHARILALSATLHLSESRFEDAARCAKTAIILSRELGDAGAEAALRSQVARILLAVGDTGGAISEAFGAMEQAQRITDRTAQLPALVECFRALAYVFLNLEQYEKAVAFCERGGELARLLGDVLSEGVLLDCSGCAYGSMASQASVTHDHERAAALLERSIANSRHAMMLARSAGHRRYEATALANAAEGLVQSGRPKDAMALMTHWPLDESSTSQTLLCHRLDTEGTICMALGRTAEAIELFGEAMRVASRPNLALAACEHLADACERDGDFPTAITHHKQLHAIYKRVASEAAQRSASFAAVYLETRETLARLQENQALATDLQLSNEQLNRRADDLLQLARYDPLTGLANRRLMDELLEQEPLEYGIVMIDVDHFKAINDGWSHLVGDIVLKRIAEIIGGCCRSADVAVRYGGDEFAVLIKRDDLCATAIIAERVRSEIERFDWTSVTERLSVSVSVGCSSGSNQGSATALAAADRRLYTAKRAGRNLVSFDDTETNSRSSSNGSSCSIQSPTLCN